MITILFGRLLARGLSRSPAPVLKAFYNSSDTLPALCLIIIKNIKDLLDYLEFDNIPFAAAVAISIKFLAALSMSSSML